MPREKIIWIIDDDLVSLYATRYRVEQAKSEARVLDFDTADIALRAFQEILQNLGQLPDIIFLDLGMPDISGWQFLEVLEQRIAKDKMPDVYILSSFSNSSDRHKAKEHASILGYFDKPLSKLDMDKTLLSFETDAN